MVVKTTIGKEKVLELKEKAVSKKQQRFFGMVRAAQKGEGAASPEVAKVAGEISKKDAKDFAKTKHKGLPEKVKVKEALSVKDTKKLNKASALDQSNDPKNQDRARARRTEVDYKDLVRQLKAKRKMKESAVLDANKQLAGPPKPKRTLGKKVRRAVLLNMIKRGKSKEEIKYVMRGESFEIDKTAHKKAQKKAKLRNLAKGNMNPNEKAAAEKKAGGPKLIGEGKTFDQWKKAAASALGRKKEEKKAEKAMDAGARAKRKLQRKEYAAKVSGSEDNVPDEMRD